MLKIPDKLVEEITSLKHRDILLIGIDGCGGAGKSTIAEKLALELTDSQVVHIDDFYKLKQQQIEVTEQTPVHVNFEFNRLKLQVLEPLMNGSNASYQNSKGEITTVKPQGYVIVEGLGTLGMELRYYFDYKIWVDSPEGTRRQRGIERDTNEWTKIWDEEYLPQDARYMREQAPQNEADWVLSNN